MPEEINFSKHTLVPQHKVLKEDDVKEVLENFNISKLQLPTILKNDPIIKLIAANPGDVIEIIRNGHAGKEKYYRRVKE